MALTDLTGTTWTLNDTLTSYAGGSYSRKTYNVNITTDTALSTYDGDVSTFVVFEVGYDGGGERNVAWLYTSTSTSWENRATLATGNDTKSLPDTWSNKFSGAFTITGGTDATNSDLIAWIEDNCTSTTPPPPPTPDVVVTYEGGNIVELSEEGAKTLKTAGMYLTDDIVLTYSGGSGGGGGGVDTAHISFESAADHVWWTDASMTLQDNAIIDDDLPIGTLIVTEASMAMPEAEPAGCTRITYGGSNSQFFHVFQVTG